VCGRFLLSMIPEEYAGLLRIAHLPALGAELFQPRMNIAPTQQIVIARVDDEGERRLDAARWGMIPHWAKSIEEIKRPIFNARSETLWDKPMFKDAAKHRRCVVPASGFYEWQKAETPRGRKQPHLIRRRDSSPMFFAGVWSAWSPKDGDQADTIRSCAILTTAPNEAMAPIHDRMPVILDSASSLDLWLDHAMTNELALKNLLRPTPPETLAVIPIDTVGDNRRTHEGPDTEFNTDGGSLFDLLDDP